MPVKRTPERKVGYQDEWVPLAEYFAAGFKVETTHGTCPDCFEQMQRDTALSTSRLPPQGCRGDAAASSQLHGLVQPLNRVAAGLLVGLELEQAALLRFQEQIVKGTETVRTVWFVRTNITGVDHLA